MDPGPPGELVIVLSELDPQAGLADPIPELSIAQARAHRQLNRIRMAEGFEVVEALAFEPRLGARAHAGQARQGSTGILISPEAQELIAHHLQPQEGAIGEIAEEERYDRKNPQ